MKGTEYRGTINITAFGIPCQQWGLNMPHAHPWNSLPLTIVQTQTMRLTDHSVIRQILLQGGNTVMFHFVFIVRIEKQCITSTLGLEYFGFANTTSTGKKCEAWIMDSPTDHDFNQLPINECRNPDLSPKGPWCYTIDNSTRYEECDIPFC
ncbi:hypothetical protein KUTeg_006415 [Tegillarca granosa]|uniref:Kringle domain-containing protein n=1 Tax=Tegillarca granosa TaxID=220873 RepID=A0ABQ9FGF4_TEGGR|nr:hypothetical protein KUTeg_006415 [Tegillarca granosa]